jgi:hypothetical protein
MPLSPSTKTSRASAAVAVTRAILLARPDAVSWHTHSAKVRVFPKPLPASNNQICHQSPGGGSWLGRAIAGQQFSSASDESLALIDHYRIVRGALYNGFGAASELSDGNSMALLAGRLHENFRDCGRLTGELQRGPLLNIQNNVLVNPDYAAAIARIVSAVAPYPDAREAVIAALRDLDAAGASPAALPDPRNGGRVIDG